VESIFIQRTLIRRGVGEICKIAVSEPYVSRAIDFRCQEGKRNEPEVDGKVFEAKIAQNLYARRKKCSGTRMYAMRISVTKPYGSVREV
jgi:hypothetical protein